MEERLQKLMAKAGLGSRRHNEGIIKAGRVSVNGKVAKLGDKANPRTDKITVDGEPLPSFEEKVYVMVNKPKGVISDEDDLGRTTVRHLVGLDGHFYPVGRLDRDSMGLILLTNDGEIAHLLTHPRYGHEKVYRVKVEGNPSNQVISAWRRGVDLEDGRTRSAAVKIIERSEEFTWLEITMKEGRKRQIRRVAALLGHPVLHLSRIQLGPLKLGDLGLGKWRYLTPKEIQTLQWYSTRKTKKRNSRRSRGKRRR
ncbi:MAG: pseudouridine synthase [Ardenticatenaceae bacterium]|nr:pseudouridine synthase [Ardenticatenaceae bacterium]